MARCYTLDLDIFFVFYNRYIQPVDKYNLSILHYSATDVGKVRRNNEDAHLVLTLQESPKCVLASVCDGVGGAQFGEVASQTAVDSLRALVVQDKLRAASKVIDRTSVLEMSAKQAHQSIIDKTRSITKYSGMACTMVSVIADTSTVCWVNVGDSRLYTLKNKQLAQVTRDQTMANALVDSGHLSEEEAATHPRRNTLQYCLGVERRDRPFLAQTGMIDWTADDKVLLCSDGLSDMVKDDVIEDCLNTTSGIETVSRLVKMALSNGGRDNITLVVLENVRS